MFLPALVPSAPFLLFLCSHLHPFFDVFTHCHHVRWLYTIVIFAGINACCGIDVILRRSQSGKAVLVDCMIVGMDVVLYQRFCRFIALAHRHDIQDGAFHPPEKGFHRRVILGIAPPGGGLDKTVIGKELLKCSGHVLRPLVGMDQDARFMELATMVTHHPVIRGLHKGYVHFQADGSTEDFCRIGILECTKVKQVPIIAMVQISDVSQDDLPWSNLEVLVYEIFRCLRFMVIGRPVLIRVLLRAVRNKVHFIHDPAALLYRDGNLMIPPQKSPEGALARHIAELLYNLPEQVL